MPARNPDLSGHTVLALHPHPDDESIFTGLTLRRLADAGARVVLVMATSGDLGEAFVPLAAGETVARRRLRELEDAAGILGVSRLVLLNRRDSGLPGDPANRHPSALCAAEPLALASRIAEIADAEGADTLVVDDELGIYGHPDHRMSGLVGSIAGELTGATVYRMTVDREHLHVTAPGGHLVHGAARAAEVEFGRVTAEIGLAVTGDAAHLAAKRAAMLAHASQITPEHLPEEGFAAAYGYEWFRRTGATPGALDLLGNAHLISGALTPAAG
ncbi:MAG: PIG-L family deacetylase [Pseudonocardia sp.]|nr:PIG-L family deacetylase [Pseudonocardia sp.]